ncbi:MAG TPA: hypothetical protein VFG62_22465, partial [Rhodopila sp.]|nr:hypothetical protein [Rhodopila sp.]
MNPLISVHVAKAGGTSVKALLQAAYGHGLAEDYADNPANPLSQRILAPNFYMSRNELLPAGASCVHGHFHPGKYAIQRGTAMFTMLRYPVDNIMSIYWFWKSFSQGTEPLHAFFLENDLTVIETARLPILRYLFSVSYFGGFDMGRFDIIGRHEDRETALTKLSCLIETPLDVHTRENITAQSEERKQMESDPWLRRRLEDILKEDIRFYER